MDDPCSVRNGAALRRGARAEQVVGPLQRAWNPAQQRQQDVDDHGLRAAVLLDEHLPRNSQQLPRLTVPVASLVAAGLESAPARGCCLHGNGMLAAAPTASGGRKNATMSKPAGGTVRDQRARQGERGAAAAAAGG